MAVKWTDTLIAMSDIDIIIPVYNEGDNILSVLKALRSSVKISFRVFICYDFEDDDTLPVVRDHDNYLVDICLLKNELEGVHGAVLTGFEASTAPAVLVLPADDDYNAGIVDRMFDLFTQGCDIVVASRFTKGGGIVNYPVLKGLLVRSASFTLYNMALVPTRDATNGMRLFSRKVLDRIEIQSTEGFVYSIELLVKCHRLGWRVGEVPAQWFERKAGRSRFRILDWALAYLRWYIYAFATTYLRLSHVPLRSPEALNATLNMK